MAQKKKATIQLVTPVKQLHMRQEWIDSWRYKNCFHHIISRLGREKGVMHSSGRVESATADR